LPDTRFTFRYDNDSGDTVRKQDNLDFSDYGGGLTGSIQTPLGGWVGAVHGFGPASVTTTPIRAKTPEAPLAPPRTSWTSPGLRPCQPLMF
jgi:hypothetical protein